MLLARILIVGSLVLATRATQETVQLVRVVQQLPQVVQQYHKLKQLRNLVPIAVQPEAFLILCHTVLHLGTPTLFEAFRFDLVTIRKLMT